LTTTLITKLLTNPLAQLRSTADAGDQLPASGRVHHTDRLSMAWKKVAKDSVALLSAEAGPPTIGASRTSSGSCPPEATNSCPVGRPDAQTHSTGVQHKLSVTAHADSAIRRQCSLTDG
jgi:hypothetical protein